MFELDAIKAHKWLFIVSHCVIKIVRRENYINYSEINQRSIS